MSTRARLNARMSATLTALAVCSHARTQSYSPKGRSGATDSVDLTGGDKGAETYARLYGPPFHTDPAGARTDPHVLHLAEQLAVNIPAADDHQRDIIIGDAAAELATIRGGGTPDRPLGESVTERDQRLIDTGEGLTAAEAAQRFRLGGGEREARRIRLRHQRYPEDGTRANATLTTDQKRSRAREMRTRGVPTRDIARALHVHQTQVMRWTKDMTTRRAA